MAQNDIKWTKTGDGTASATVGHENGPFQTWQTGGTYESLYDQAIGEIFTDVMPQVTIGGFYEHIANGNVVSFPRGEVYTETDFEDSYDITQPLTLQARSGTIRTCSLDHVIKIGIIFQNFEIQTSGSGRLAFEYRQAIEGQARKFETVTVNDLIAGGIDSNDLIAWDQDTEGNYTTNIYKTFQNIRAKLVERGFAMDDLDVYVTPDIINAIMNDSHFISTFGNSNIASEEVRFGFRGMYLGFAIYESGRLPGMYESMPTKADMLFVARSQVILCRFPVQQLMIQPAPATHIDCSILSGLEYFKHFIVNDYGIRYLDFTHATHN